MHVDLFGRASLDRFQTFLELRIPSSHAPWIHCCERPDGKAGASRRTAGAIREDGPTVTTGHLLASHASGPQWATRNTLELNSFIPQLMQARPKPLDHLDGGTEIAAALHWALRNHPNQVDRGGLPQTLTGQWAADSVNPWQWPAMEHSGLAALLPVGCSLSRRWKWQGRTGR